MNQKPILHVRCKSGDIVAILVEGHSILGIWRGPALVWVCEAIKPLTRLGVVEIRTDVTGSVYWDGVKEATQVVPHFCINALPR